MSLSWQDEGVSRAGGSGAHLLFVSKATRLAFHLRPDGLTFDLMSSSGGRHSGRARRGVCKGRVSVDSGVNLGCKSSGGAYQCFVKTILQARGER